MSVEVLIDDRVQCKLNDPSDAADWLIHDGLPRELFLKTKPDGGPSWNDLPLNFYWNCHKYTVQGYDHERV